jgi:3-deoxy-D-manno-octulosonic-acid transferase
MAKSEPTPPPSSGPAAAASGGGLAARLARASGSNLVRYIRWVRRSSRVVYEPADAVARFEQHAPMIMALWHGQFLLLPALCPPTVKVKTMVARHGDGDIIGSVITAFNMGLIRGAGAGTRKRDRGGARALLAAKTALGEGVTVGMTADVPPGPARVAGLGIVTLARISGRPVVPVAVASSRYQALDTWSRLTVNLPYSTLGVVVGEPILVPPDADDAALERARLAVERELNRVTGRAYAIAGSDPARATPPSADPLAPPAAASIRLKLYRGVMRAAEPLAPLVIKWRARADKEDLTRQHERLGRPVTPRPAGRLVWVHAASVGETNAVLPLIDALRAARPDVRFLLTTGTRTSAGLAVKRLGPNDIHQYVPFDGPNFVARFIAYWRPDLGIFTESDIWPNLIFAAAQQGVPLALVNGRLSPRSFKRWHGNRAMSRPLFNRFAVVLAQTEKLGRWFRDIGARRVEGVGNLKVDAPPLPVDAAALAVLTTALGGVVGGSQGAGQGPGQWGGRLRMIASCTHEGEEELIAAAHVLLRAEFAEFCTIIAPRHPERGPVIVAMLRARGLTVAQRSKSELPGPGTDIYVADTIGELGTLYALAPVAFLGKSLVGDGGQNPIEAMRFGTVVLTGPATGNFAETYALLRHEKGVIDVTSAATLAAAVTTLLRDEAALAAVKAGAQKALDKLSGALPKTLAALLEFLPEAPVVDPLRAAAPPANPTADLDTRADLDAARLQRVS